jgi:hypothetical protein
MPTLTERARKIWTDAGIEEVKVNWLVSCLTDEAIANNEKFTNADILRGKNHLLWYGLKEALVNYVAWENNQA